MLLPPNEKPEQRLETIRAAIGYRGSTGTSGGGNRASSAVASNISAARLRPGSAMRRMARHHGALMLKSLW